jgi:large subunit ribosomal protein L10e
MALRKASTYSKKFARPYTRNSRKKNRAYIKTIPQVKIAKYNLGDQKAYQLGKHKFFVRLLADEDIQIRDNALEAGRMHVHKVLEEKTPGQYFFVVKVHPHHLLRNNKTAAGAGADRMSTGMSHSFGTVEGRAALVKKGKQIFMVSCENEQAARVARAALETIRAKMPCATKISFELPPVAKQ